MTVTVTGDIADATGQPDSRDWEAWSPVYRAGTNTVVTMRPQTVRVVGGQFVGEFEPGPVLLKNPEGQQFYITVPDADANLGDLIAVATGVPPDTGADLLAAAVDTYLTSEGVPWGNVNGKPAYIGAGASPAVARSAIDAAGSKDAYKALARNPDGLITGSITRNANGAATTAAVVWPDGTPGTYTALALSTAFPGAVDSYQITYGSPVTATYTQAAVTRDSTTGAVTSVPAIAVS